MPAQPKGNSYELGRRLVKGPRRAVANQAASYEKSVTGNTKSPHKGRGRKKQTKTKNSKRTFNVIQLNISGINTKKTELAHFLSENNVHIALLQETLHKGDAPTITGYTPEPCNCTECRGLITYVRNDITADVVHLTSNHPTDVQKCTAWYNNKKYTIYNVYSPPWSTCGIKELQDTTYRNTVVAGDFNGHSPQWGYSDTNSTGKYLEELEQSTNLTIRLDDPTPTLLHKAHKTLSRPDLTLISSDLDANTEVLVLPGIGSDHKPIITKVREAECGEPHHQRLRWNFRKADWTAFKITSDEEYKTINTQKEDDINKLEERFTTIVLKAAKKHIPRGSCKKYKPFWNKDIESAVNNRHQARETVGKNPTTENKIAYNRATAIAKRTIAKSKKDKWTKACADLDLRRDGSKAWNLLNNLSQKKLRTNPKPMQDGETAKKRSEIFNKFFASINKSDKKESDKCLLKELKEREKSQITQDSIFDDPFTPEELEQAIHNLKTKKSPGPDKVHNEMIKNLGQVGKQTLLDIINQTWKKGQLPKMWKNAYVVPILKKDKDPRNPESYRPISLTSCIGKVAERMVNRRLYWWLETSGLLCEEQAGFRTGSRTEDQLFTLCQKVQDGFQAGQHGHHTTAVFIDLQQAYDRVWRKGLMLKMQRMGINGKMYRWLKSFLIERTIQTRVDNSLSSKRVLEEGIPQGSALSCTLFLIFINDMVQEIRSEKALYADDLVIWNTHRYTRQSARYLNQDLERLSKYCTTWKISISTNKTTYSIFTLSPKANKQNLDIKIGQENLKKTNQPTYLGVQLDSRLTFNRHINNLKRKATKRLSLIKRLASTTWGSDLDTLRTLYISYVRSILDYNQSLQLSSSETTLLELDRVQNHALRFICGGMRSTPTNACEIHTSIEPLALRRNKAALELQERCERLNQKHPARKTVEKWKPKNRIKHQSILHNTSLLKEKCHLPEEKEPLKRTSDFIPPHLSLHMPEIYTALINENINKKSDPVLLQRVAEDTINRYQEDWIHIYTDGSAFKATVNAGFGVYVCFPDGSSHTCFDACGSICSNYNAELYGIQAALKYLHSTFQADPSKKNNAVIFTDSMSALQAMENRSVDKEAAHTRIIIHKLMTAFSIRLALQWIPGHTNLPGNEMADRLAKKGSSSDQPNKSIPLKTAKQIINQYYHEDWMNMWATGSKARHVYKYMSKPNPKDNIRSLDRRDQTAIFRLRTQHNTLNGHLNRINPQHPPMCPLCNHPYETTPHLLFECPSLQHLRQELLPPAPNIQNVLYCTADQLKRTSAFYRMALGLRAQAQRLLD